MGFKSFLSAIGHGAEGVLKFLATDRGQKDIQIAEAAAVTIGTGVGGPGLGAGIAGIELLVNKGLAGVFGMEATAATLGAQSGTGVKKGIVVAAGLEPLAEQLIKDLGYENPTVDQVELITSTVAKAMADIVNSVPPPAALVDAPAVAPVVDVQSDAGKQPSVTKPTMGMVSR
jgi:hypothetical protein